MAADGHGLIADADSRVDASAPVIDLQMVGDLPTPDTVVVKPDTGGPTLLYENDFSAATGMTSGGDGNFLVQDGILEQTTCQSVPDAMVTGKSWGDVKVKIQFLAYSVCGDNGYVGLLVRAQGVAGCTGNTYYGCIADFDNQELRVGKMDGNCTTSGWSKKSVFPSIESNKWYTMVLESKGNDFTCSVWGGWIVWPVIHKWSDPQAPLIPGSAGVLTSGVQARFDNFSVTSN